MNLNTLRGYISYIFYLLTLPCVYFFFYDYLCMFFFIRAEELQKKKEKKKKLRHFHKWWLVSLVLLDGNDYRIDELSSLSEASQDFLTPVFHEFNPW